MRCLVWFSYGRPRVFALPDLPSFQKIVIALRAGTAGWGIEEKAFVALEKAILGGSMVAAERRITEFLKEHGLNEHEMFEAAQFIRLE